MYNHFLYKSSVNFKNIQYIKIVNLQSTILINDFFYTFNCTKEKGNKSLPCLCLPFCNVQLAFPQQKLNKKYCTLLYLKSTLKSSLSSFKNGLQDI